MDKLGDPAASKFINALIKSVQTLCHGYLDFQTGIEIIGHINLSVDKGGSLDYILKEKVCKNAENSTLFISNSFYAESKTDQEVVENNEQSKNQVVQNSESEFNESGRVSTAISSISSALTGSKERSRRSSGAKDSSSTHSRQNAVKRKASESENSESHPAKVSYHHENISAESSFPSSSRASPVDSKESLRALRADIGMSETMLPETANVRADSSDIGVNLAGSVLEPVEESQNNPDLPEGDDDSDGDLEVTFIKEEFVEGEISSCDFENSGRQQFHRGPHQRASEGMSDSSLFPVSLHTSSASASYVPSAHELGAAGQQYPPGTSGPSTSQPQPGPSGMRGSALGFDGAAETYTTSANFLSQPFITSSFSTLLPMASASDSYFQKESSQSKTLFVCEFCDASFTFDSSLNRHRNSVHLNKNLHVCSVCGKGITRKENFEDHMNMHKNIKAHKCQHCGAGFTFKNKLRLHIRTYHP